MKYINRLLAWLGLHRGNDSNPNDQLSTVAKILRELHTTINAEALALRAAVEDSTDTLAGVEQQLEAGYSGALTRIEALFAPVLGVLDARLNKLLSRMSPKRLDAVERTCSLELARLRAQTCAPLVALRRIERRTLRTLRAFRFHHRLSREARYPDSRTLHYSALAFVCVLEAVANTAAFAEGSELGLTGGFMNGLLIAATNVAFAFFTGRAAMGFFHRCWHIKVFTALILSAWATFEITYALAVAHYRIALTASVDTAPTLALDSLINAPLAIGDLISVLLTVFTIAFGVVALFAGLDVDDRYPGYGAIDRTWLRAQTQLRAIREQTLGALDAVFLPAPERLRIITQEAASTQDAYRQTLETMKRTYSTLEHALGEVNTAYREAQLTARSAFTRVRGIASVTGEPEALCQSALFDRTRARIDAATEALRDFPARLARLEAEKATTEARIQRDHERALEAMPAFFALADTIAARESTQDEADVERARQQMLWEEEINDAESIPNGQTSRSEEIPEHDDSNS